MTLSFCSSQVKKYDYYRYLCCLLSPSNLQERFFAVYAFNSEIAKIKEVVSEPMVGHIRLQWWRDAIDEIYDGIPVKHNHEIVHALYKVICAVDIDKELFERLLDAREADIEFTAPETLDNLKNYAIGTCSNLFLLLLAACEIDDKHAAEAAHYGGIAYALTGIMRAMRHNAQHGMVMLPLDLMERFGISEDDVTDGKNLEKTYAITKIICENVSENLRQYRLAIKQAPKSTAHVFLPISIIEVFLNRIEKNNYDLFNGDIEGSRFGVQMRILKWWLM
jgi:phytoene synthase